MEISKQILIEGNKVIFCTKDKEDYREAELSYSYNRLIGKNLFLIWFNGALIYTSKTYGGLVNRFNQLNSKWNLEFKSIENGIQQ